MLMSASVALTDKESKAFALDELRVIFFSLMRLGSCGPVGGGLACAKTNRGKHKKRNIRSTLNCFSKGIDFENNSCLGSKRFFVNLALNITPKSVLLFKPTTRCRFIFKPSTFLGGIASHGVGYHLFEQFIKTKNMSKEAYGYTIASKGERLIAT